MQENKDNTKSASAKSSGETKSDAALPVSTERSDAAKREERILEFWQKENIFKKTLEKGSASAQGSGETKEFVFFEGPPTANAKPALHHLEARAFKDVIPRYKTMQGYHVRRKAGWDTHGLPVELQIEKKLGLQSKKEIEQYGVAKFNKECRESVFEFIKEWENFTDRIGYWVDKNDAYFTFDKDYVESLWSVVGKINERGLFYKDYRIVPWCPRCGTGLSSHELAQGYMDVKDLSVYAKFKIVGTDNGYFLAWTTTPWTLPGNVGLAVGNDIDYVEAKVGNEILVLAKERLALLTDSYEVIAEHKGSEMVGMQYEPLYPYLSELNANDEKMANAYKVYAADFVTTEDGTGIVHTAVMYGADDFALGTKVGLPKFHLVAEDGHFIKGTDFLENRFVKDEDVAIDIIKDLAHRGLLFKKEKYEHSYPHCWRCKTPLIYYARDSWYIRMSELRDTLIAENQKINWEPEHIKDGRFGEWLRELKDWAISRERYWGTPLPVWESQDGEQIFIDSFETLKKHIKKSGNSYFVMRHGETDGNLHSAVCTVPTGKFGLTEHGKAQADQSGEVLAQEGIDLIICSDFMRVQETAARVADKLGISKDAIITDVRLREFRVSSFEGKSWDEYHEQFPKTVANFTAANDGDETYQDLKNRVTEFLYDIDAKYSNKKILVITHGAPAWLMVAGAEGKNVKETLAMLAGKEQYHYLGNAEFQKLDFIPIPHNDNFELDPHRPYIDEVVLEKNGKEFRRVKEVMDVWFDSGAMPFAQDHYPFENKERVEGAGYPADFISEAIDQTRGWFYTLLAIGVLMDRGTPYKNVICLGHLLDAQGRKMSKSVGNVIEPWGQMEKFGVDVIRLWMYSVNQPGEGKNYDEKVILELSRKVFQLLDNCFVFYDTYKSDTAVDPAESKNVLDQWILALLAKMQKDGTGALDKYDLFTASRLIRDFANEFSTWYIRRSRDRFKEDGEDKEYALATTKYVFLELAKYMAPFTPFYAEDLYKRAGGEKESVHLEDWNNEYGILNIEIISEMETVRDVVTKGLEARQKAGIKVRQPLSKLSTPRYSFVDTLRKEGYVFLILDELNIKEIDFCLEEGKDVELDAEITSELKQEGDYRELVRAIQDMRKSAGLTPQDKINLSVETNDEGKALIEKFDKELKQTVLADSVAFEPNDGQEIKVDNLTFKVKLQ